MFQIGRRGTTRRLFENFKKFSKVTEFEFQNSGPSFLRLCLLCIVKKFHSIQTKLKFAPMAIPAMALLQQHDARRDILIEPAARQRAAIEARGHSELGAQSDHKNQPACLSVSVREDISGTTRAIFTNFLCMLPVSVARSFTNIFTIGHIAYRQEGVFISNENAIDWERGIGVHSVVQVCYLRLRCLCSAVCFI